MTDDRTQQTRQGRSVSKLVEHGTNDLECPVFEVPLSLSARDVLLGLARYWAGLRILRAWNMFSTGVIGRVVVLKIVTEWLEEIAELLGSDVVREVVEDAEVSFGRSLGPARAHEWQIFLHGTEAEREATTSKLRVELEGSCGR